MRGVHLVAPVSGPGGNDQRRGGYYVRCSSASLGGANSHQMA
jgi:hypothetical protein